MVCWELPQRLHSILICMVSESLYKKVDLGVPPIVLGHIIYFISRRTWYWPREGGGEEGGMMHQRAVRGGGG